MNIEPFLVWGRQGQKKEGREQKNFEGIDFGDCDAKEEEIGV